MYIFYVSRSKIDSTWTPSALMGRDELCPLLFGQFITSSAHSTKITDAPKIHFPFYCPFSCTVYTEAKFDNRGITFHLETDLIPRATVELFSSKINTSAAMIFVNTHEHM